MTDIKPNWNVITDLALKAADDAKEAMSRTVFLAENPVDATLVSMVAYAILRGEHDAIKEQMVVSPVIAAAAEMADDVAEKIKGHKREELKQLLPLVREVLKARRGGGPRVG